MASGQTLLYLDPRSGLAPESSAALLDFLLGTSSPKEAIPILSFDSASIQYIDFRAKMPQNYAGGGITLVVCSGAGTTTGGVRWEAAFRRIEDDAEDLDTTAFTYDYNGVTVSALPTAVGEVTYDNVTFTNGADMDSVAAGEEFILRIRRKTDDAGDTAAAAAYLHGLEIRES